MKKEIVGHCPLCGAPIYGETTIEEGSSVDVGYSCQCRFSINTEKKYVPYPNIPWYYPYDYDRYTWHNGSTRQ